ncbi:MAG: hypothetical protein HYX79_09005 [Chloroflexi bacterium]|nr:hypothetical protein [Chloroflexota bacterium]
MITKGTLKDWLIILAALLDDIAVALVVLLVLYLLDIPVSPEIIVFLALFVVAFAVVMHKAVIPAIHRRKETGKEGMLGMEGEVTEPLTPAGCVCVKNERWNAKSLEGDIQAGEKVEVVEVEGLTLKVKRKEK